MPLLRIDACGVATQATEELRELRAALDTAPQGPIIILLHGYRFTPENPAYSPHNHIFSDQPDPQQKRAISWPRHLGFGRDLANEGLCIGFGWHARGTIWQAYRAAKAAGKNLAKLINIIAELAPDRGINIMAHSLGARVFLTALPHIKSAPVKRAVLMAAAEMRDVTDGYLASLSGQSVEILNITSRENDLFDLLVETAIAPLRPTARSLGHGLATPQHNWLDLQLDCPKTLRNLRHAGYPIAPPSRRVCHWSAYLRAGMFPLYSRYLRAPEALSINQLRQLVPPTPEPRWARFMPALMPNRPLPFERKR